jgi:hypothetical protein
VVFITEGTGKKGGRWYSWKAGKAENAPWLGIKNIKDKSSNVGITQLWATFA